MRGTLMPKAWVGCGFSVPARKYAPKRVRSITYQVAKQTVNEATMTQARYFGKIIKPRSNAPENISGPA